MMKPTCVPLLCLVLILSLTHAASGETINCKVGSGTDDCTTGVCKYTTTYTDDTLATKDGETTYACGMADAKMCMVSSEDAKMVVCTCKTAGCSTDKDCAKCPAESGVDAGARIYVGVLGLAGVLALLAGRQ